MVIQRVFGANHSEVAFASAGGGTHVYLSGTDIGSAFSPPTVFVGINADAQCVVQPFTTTRNRLHCIVYAEGLPPPDALYDPTGRFAEHPLRVLKGGRLADCWHVGGINHNCILRFDLGGTPRVHQLLTRELQSAGLLRLLGRGIDGGLLGAPDVLGTLFRGGQLVVGACGEKDCAPSNLGVASVGCLAREGGSEGDAVSGQGNAVATAYTDDASFGCKLDALASGLAGGYFNLSLHSMGTPARGDAYMGFATTTRIDLTTGAGL